ncbi:16S rRNA (guanine(527)-N(7))-methyltransferase RsmG [Candidimonas sp. SYP-B2681]|uniref:16S rRNA (guanine(527)-N(7))-methyltransferase RsmG n=1 Tax=Candidimonas sp. SYP-B2681 TaxID=2497686 RepID=UPI000F88DB33|nr:16S rRNA (guanine(527)-N(7))-methyltransferase RsmG [Candidimonas sp. SYP-B2681]RTZ43422.1 16S rRNA (guanine(527)-N(7))-methyltransferase RsmG [Candidimonas sp. SYP-B2681]
MAEQTEYRQRLDAAALALNVNLEPAQADALLSYIGQLQRWNRTYNLTALREPEQMLVQHLFDSLSVVKPIVTELYKTTATSRRIVDVGSGAGLPGVVLAIMQPEWEVFCVDAVEKKMAFVRQMASVLRLPNLHAIHARVETLPPFNADIVVSRAFASLIDFARLAGLHVAENGHLLAMKGREPQDEIDTLEQQTDWRQSHLQTLLVPELNAQRCLVWLSRQGIS